MRSVLTALATFLLLNLTQGHLTKSHEHHHSTPHSFSSRASALTSQSTAWIPLPPGEKVRGVNLGSWFIIEPVFRFFLSYFTPVTDPQLTKRKMKR